ncbi:MAG: hypothetical protein NC916_02815 [Candidatus Omnitrophica bacterium]|nr:hypothetical protein [Candidatus Omnitrophota bacterium]
MRGWQRALSVLEYVIFITVIISALIGINVYLKSALSGKWRGTGDIFGHGRQYEPNRTIITGP